MKHVSAAIRREHWAIKPEWLAAICDIAERCVADRAALEAHLHALPANAVRESSTLSLAPLPGARVSAYYNGVAVVPVSGPIFPYANLFTNMSGATALSDLHKDLTTALDNSAVKAIVLKIDSPGGAVTGVADFANRVRGLRGQMPVIAHIDGNGCSAAYWIAAAAREIAIERTSVAGSIGVATTIGVQEAPDSEGVRPVRVVSTNAPDKTVVDASDESLAKVRAMLDAIEAEFIGDVAALRGVSRETVISDFGNGGVRVGADAVAMKMADRVESFDDTLKRIAAEVAPKVAAGARRASIERDIDIRARAV